MKKWAVGMFLLAAISAVGQIKTQETTKQPDGSETMTTKRWFNKIVSIVCDDAMFGTLVVSGASKLQDVTAGIVAAQSLSADKIATKELTSTSLATGDINSSGNLVLKGNIATKGDLGTKDTPAANIFATNATVATLHVASLSVDNIVLTQNGQSVGTWNANGLTMQMGASTIEINPTTGAFVIKNATVSAAITLAPEPKITLVSAKAKSDWTVDKITFGPDIFPVPPKAGIAPTENVLDPDSDIVYSVYASVYERTEAYWVIEWYATFTDHREVKPGIYRSRALSASVFFLDDKGQSINLRLIGEGGTGSGKLALDPEKFGNAPGSATLPKSKVAGLPEDAAKIKRIDLKITADR